MKTQYKWTSNRILDTLNKYSNHQIVKVEQYDDWIKLHLEYVSEKFKSRTCTYVYLYADGVDE